MSKRFLTVAFAACLFSLIVTAKWATFDRFGSPMPDWDQWDAEAVELFVPWFEHDHFLQHLFHPHNEHRVVVTKLHNLTLGLLNGQWDSRLEAGTNAALHAAIAVALWLFGRRRLDARWHAPLFVIIFALFGLPFAWQNVLGGFHSQQFWLLGLSLAAIVTLPFSTPRSASWWLGAVSAILALVSMGSGLLAAAIVLVLAGWRCARREVRLREAWPTLVLAAVVFAVGMATRVDAPWHAHMKVKTLHDFFLSMVHSAQWPWRDHNWLAAVLWLPWLLTLGRIISWPREGESDASSRDSHLHSGQIIAALGGWVMIQIAATAYARGADAGWPASRYMDTLAMGATANALALGWLLTAVSTSRFSKIIHALAGLAWVVTFALGFYPMMNIALRYELPDAKKYYFKAEGNMRRYLATNDPKQLAHPDIPYPSADALVERLAQPSLRALMPVPIRSPLPLEAAATNSSTPFVANDARQSGIEHPPQFGLSPATPPLDYSKSWGSYAADGVGATAQGEWESRPITLTRTNGWLRFETAGHLGEPGVALELRDAASGAVLAKVQPSKIPGDTWRAAYVPKPHVPFVIVARDEDPTRWLAFGGPIEMGPLSYWAWQANKHGQLLFLITAGVTLVLGFASLLPPRRPS